MSNNNGYIKLSRNIMSHWIWQDAERFQWWCYLLMSAEWKDRKVLINSHMITLQRGQLVESAVSFAERWNKSRPTVIKFLKTLQADGMIDRSTLYGSISVITICNYDTWQGQDGEGVDTSFDSTLDTSLDTSFDSTLDTSPINKNIKNIKNDNNINLSLSRTCEEMKKRGFEVYGEFQNVYLKAVQRRALDERYGRDKASAYIEDLSCKLEEGSDEQITNSRSHYATLLHWLSYKKMREEERSAPKQPRMKINLNALKPDSDERYS